MISAFGREFAKTQRVPVEFHRYLIEAQALRTTGDYGQLNALTNEQAAEQIDHAEKIVAFASQTL